MGITKWPESSSSSGGGYFPVAEPVMHSRSIAGDVSSTIRRMHYLPHKDFDGSYFTIPTTSTGTYNLTNASNTSVWGVGIASFTGAGFTGFHWYDTDNDLIYVFTYDSLLLYLDTVSTVDGTVVNIGSCTPDGTTNPFSALSKYCFTMRVSTGSGDITLREGNQSITIDSTDGSVVTPLSSYVGGHYITSDGSVSMAHFYSRNSSGSDSNSFKCDSLSNNTTTTESFTLPYQGTKLPGPYLGDVVNYTFIIWGDDMVATEPQSASFMDTGYRFTTRAEMDAYVIRLATHFGVI